ncbi:MAG: hypothetical protein AB1472_07335 [Candidatus Omnitrophota bacterium]
MKHLEWHTEKRKISDLTLFEGNPRQMTEKQAKDLLKSLQKFNLVEIPAIDQNNRVIAGNMRIQALQTMGRGNDEIDVRVANRDLTEDEAREYLIRSNKNVGEWDWDLLANFDERVLLEIGFNRNELEDIFDVEIQENNEGDYPITAKLYEHYNFVTIVTENDIDQAFLENFFEVKSRKSYKKNRVGRCRVVRFSEIESKLKEGKT